MKKYIKKGLHVRKSTVFLLQIGDEQKKDLHAARSLPSSGVEEFFKLLHHFVICNTFVKVFERSLNVLLMNLKLFLQIHHSLKNFY